jgi:hypothetical protein
MLSAKIKVFGIFLIILTNIATAQKLDEFEKKAKGTSESNETSESSDSHDDETNIHMDYDFDDEDIENTFNIFGAFIDITGGLLFYFPEIDGDINDLKYTQFPYSDGSSGTFSYNANKVFSIKTDVHYFQLNRKLTGIGIMTKISPHPFVEFQFDYTRLSEKVDFDYNHLDFFNLFINFNRVRSESFILSWGLGLKTIFGNSTQNAFGLNFGTELFPVKPISVSFFYNIGFFKGATVDEMLLNLNLHVHRFKISFGYQKFRAGDIDFPGMTLGIGFFI